MNYYIVDGQWYSSDELYHHGIKGMKWGVRRYQNEDGTLTAAGKKRLSKSLSKEYKRNYDSAQPFKTSEKYNKQVSEAVDKFTTVADKKRIKSAKDKWLASINEADNAEKTLDKLAEGYGKKYYDNELRKNPDSYSNERAKEKLYEYSVYDYGYDKARKSRPDLGKIINASNKHYTTYMEECKKYPILFLVSTVTRNCTNLSIILVPLETLLVTSCLLRILASGNCKGSLLLRLKRR